MTGSRSSRFIRQHRFVGAVTMSGATPRKAVIREQEAELRGVLDSDSAMVWGRLPYGSNSYVKHRFGRVLWDAPEQIAGSGWHAANSPMILGTQR